MERARSRFMNKKILSFDGGGIRGVISLTFLKNLEKDTTISISQKADLIAGTSTGSIIAAALGVGMTPDEILDFYTSMNQKIFKAKEGIDHFLSLKAKYSSQNLYQALEQAFSSKGFDPQTPLNKLPKQLVIPTTSLDDKELKRWRTQILTSDSEISLIDAMMESTAAPTFFPSYNDHVDGGMAANDPSLVAYSIADGAKALLSFGTGYTAYNISKGEDWGTLSWILDLSQKSQASKTPLLTMLFDVQDQLPGQLCALLLKEQYLRLNFQLSKSVSLSAVSELPSLIQETENYIKKHSAEWKTYCKWVESRFG